MNLLQKLDCLNDEKYFFEKIGTVKEEIKEIEALKNDLKKNFSKNDLINFDLELNSLTKQIQEKFDYIINEKKLDIASVSKQIKNLHNSKKLAAYR
jgi:competence transcription factor ComK